MSEKMKTTMIISVRKGEKSVSHLKALSLVGEGILEVQHLQKWILEKPEVLGEDLLVLDEQFAGFESAKDRLDVLCLDRRGHIVVVELKRTETAEYADLQALRYAAMVRPINITSAAQILANSSSGRAQGLTEKAAKEEILSFIQGEEEEGSGELQSEPRIILVSSGFSKQVLTTVDYLLSHNIDVTCIALSAYSISEGHYVVVPDVVMPLREIEDYLVKLREKKIAQDRAARDRAPPSLLYLYQNGFVKGGENVFLKHNLPDYVKPHYKDDDPTFEGTIVIEDGTPRIRWAKDGQAYSPSDLTATVFHMYHPNNKEHISVSGSYHWGTGSESLRGWVDRVRALPRTAETEEANA
ncbi:MAG: hypothetical protein JRN36_02285 [Nitrososphaerota archaeon]|nr:hypothetical protein [Nitrososphaerota archaeon]